MEEDKRKRPGARRLKHPVLKNVEYASIVRNGKSVLEIDGKEIVNIAWRDFQIYVGDKIGVGRFHFTIKFKNNDELYTGTTKGIDPNINVVKSDESDSIIKTVTDAFKSLESKLNSETQKGGITYEMLLSSTKQGYDTQVDFLKQQITYKDGSILDLRIEIKDLTAELIQTDITIRDLEKQSGYAQLLEPVGKMLLAKFGAGKPVSLGESDPSAIPNEVLEVLGIIDYTKIQPVDLNKIINLLKQYITATNLPLKGQ